MTEQDNNEGHLDDLVEEETPEGNLPRRAASAEFVVTAEAGSEAALREAMDPANQSFADALRLSFRILQLGMLALLAVFLFSGFQTVEEGDLGVQTRNPPGYKQAAGGSPPRRKIEFYVQDNLALEHLDADAPKADFVYDNSAYNNLRNGKVFEGLLDRCGPRS